MMEFLLIIISDKRNRARLFTAGLSKIGKQLRNTRRKNTSFLERKFNFHKVESSFCRCLQGVEPKMPRTFAPLPYNILERV